MILLLYINKMNFLNIVNIKINNLIYLNDLSNLPTFNFIAPSYFSHFSEIDWFYLPIIFIFLCILIFSPDYYINKKKEFINLASLSTQVKGETSIEFMNRHLNKSFYSSINFSFFFIISIFFYKLYSIEKKLFYFLKINSKFSFFTRDMILVLTYFNQIKFSFFYKFFIKWLKSFLYSLFKFYIRPKSQFKIVLNGLFFSSLKLIPYIFLFNLPFFYFESYTFSSVFLFNNILFISYSNLFMSSTLSTICAVSTFFVLFDDNYYSSSNFSVSLHSYFENTYECFFLFLCFFISFLPSVFDLNAIYLVLEIITFLLVSLLFSSLKKTAIEAGAKYFCLSALSSGLMLLGAFFIYLYTGSTCFFNIKSFFIFYSGEVNLNLLIFAMYLVILAFLFKLSAYPCHFWVLDIYSGCSYSLLFLISVPLKISIFWTLSNFLLHSVYVFFPYWRIFIICCSVGSSIFSFIGLFHDQNLKRFIGYSSIGHYSILLLNLCSGLTIFTYYNFFFYIFYYALSSITLFYIIISYRHYSNNQTVRYFSDFKNIYKINFYAAFVLSVSLFSLSGIPPFLGFFAKYQILLEFARWGDLTIVVFFIIFSTISAYGYLRFIRVIWFNLTIGNTRKNVEHYRFLFFYFIQDYKNYGSFLISKFFILLIIILQIFPFLTLSLFSFDFFYNLFNKCVFIYDSPIVNDFFYQIDSDTN